MTSERQANRELQSYSEKVAAERAAWAKVLSVPAKPVSARPAAKAGLLSRLFGFFKG